MTRAELAAIFRRERSRFPAAGASLRLQEQAPANPRAMAYTVGRRVHFYERALRLHRRNVVALVRHELAHAALSHASHTEREADALAEAITGRRIRYDAAGLQTIGRGCWPRPRRLR